MGFKVSESPESSAYFYRSIDVHKSLGLNQRRDMVEHMKAQRKFIDKQLFSRKEISLPKWDG